MKRVIFITCIFILIAILPVSAVTFYADETNTSGDPWAGYMITGSITGTAPFMVHFVDMSRNNPSQWNWSFQDVTGNNTEIWFSQDKNPNYTFDVGNFSIKLNSSNQDGNNITSMLAFVNVTNTPSSGGFNIYTVGIWIYLVVWIIALLVMGLIYHDVTVPLIIGIISIGVLGLLSLKTSFIVIIIMSVICGIVIIVKLLEDYRR